MEPWLSPLYDAEGIRAVDRWAIDEQGVPEGELMEAAGTALADAVAALPPQGPVRILCGKGNNGGDGLVAARRLRRSGFDVDVLELFADEPPADLGAWLEGSGAVVDAIFGTGFSGEPREPAAAAIDAANRCGAPIVACDIASGVEASSGEVAGVAIEAALTVSFHAAKVGHRVAPGKWHTGELRVAPIGIPDGAPPAPVAGTIAPAVLGLAPRRGQRSTKFSSGQVAIAGGSRGLAGAVQMCSLAAIRAGAGYATVAVPAEIEPVVAAARPEVMSVACPGGDGCLAPASAKAVLRTFERAAGGVLGPGLGRDPGAVELAREVIGAIEAPLVVDADGLNAFAGHLDPIAAREAPTILTPHEGELGRLLGREATEVAAHRLSAARAAAETTGAIVVLKGDDTIVADPRRGGLSTDTVHSPPRVAVNVVSAPALATAGTGDVLSGITAALLARGLDPFAAACAAVLAHARAGLDATRRVGAAESVIAGDVIDSIPAGLLPGSAVE
jgi:NAD(P)H-hydrate epimerase